MLNDDERKALWNQLRPESLVMKRLYVQMILKLLQAEKAAVDEFKRIQATLKKVEPFIKKEFRQHNATPYNLSSLDKEIRDELTSILEWQAERERQIIRTWLSKHFTACGYLGVAGQDVVCPEY